MRDCIQLFDRWVGVSVCRVILVCITTLALVPACAMGGGETAGETAGEAADWDPRDFEGIWQNSLRDITNGMLPGEEISFTAYGAEMYRSFDLRDMSLKGCNIKGLQRHLMSNFYSMFVQEESLDMMVILHEDQHRFREIYLDGRPHPEEMYDLPEPFGHSIGQWEGDTLVVDSVGFHDTTYMDRAGLGHSTELHLVERFLRTGPDTIDWTVTVEDSLVFTKPFTYSGTFTRQTGVRLMTYNCQNERDHEYLESVVRGENGPTHAHPEHFVFPD